MGFNGDLLGFTRNLVGFSGDLMGFFMVKIAVGYWRLGFHGIQLANEELITSTRFPSDD